MAAGDDEHLRRLVFRVVDEDQDEQGHRLLRQNHDVPPFAAKLEAGEGWAAGALGVDETAGREAGDVA